MTNILLINIPHISFKEFITPDFNAKKITKRDGKYYGNILTDMPLGLLSLSAYVKKYSSKPNDISFIDFNIELNEADGFIFNNFYDYFLFVLKKIVIRPEVVGVSSLFSTSYHSLLHLGKAVKTLWPECILVTGGPVPSGCYKEIYRDSHDFDGICYGEGEKPFLGLIESDDKKKYLQTSRTWITSKKIVFGDCFEHDFVENLDDIPFYDYDLLNAEKYGHNPSLTAYHGVGEHAMNFHVMTSLGCPFKCTFCASHKVHGRKMRYWSMERVESDLTQLKNKFGAKTIVVQDDHLMGDPDRALKILKIICNLNLKVVFQNGLAMYALSRVFLETLKEAGVEQLLLSIESGNENTLKNLMKKPLKLDIVQRVVNDCRELGIYTNANILIGMPGETHNDIEITRAFLKTISPNWFMIFCASPLVGSEMYEEAVRKNYLVEGFVGGGDFKRAVLKTDEFTPDYIQKMAYFLNLEINFVHNSDIRLGNYSLALRGIENAIKARDDHALAYYYAGLCYSKLGDLEKGHSYLEKSLNIAKENPFWRSIFEYFNLPMELDGDRAFSTFPENKSENTKKSDFITSSKLENIFGYLNA